MPININGNGAITGVASLGAPTQINSGADNLVLEADPTAAHADTTIGLEIDGARVVTIDNNGRILNGATASIVLGNTQGNYQFQGPNGERGAYTAITYRDDTLGPILCLAKSRGTGVNDFTAVQSGDQLGDIRWTGTGGSDAAGLSARVSAEATSTFTDTSKPGALVFSTASNGSETVTERMRIDQDGRVILATAANCPGIAWDDNDTTGANVSSRTLGDYEVGTFTPKYITSNGGDAGIAHLLQNGDYVKIGNLVYVSVQLATSDWTTGVDGLVFMDDFPYPISTTGPNTGSGFTIGFRREFATNIGGNLTARFVSNNGTKVYLYKHATNSATSLNVDESDFLDGGSENYVYGSGWYFTDS